MSEVFINLERIVRSPINIIYLLDLTFGGHEDPH